MVNSCKQFAWIRDPFLESEQSHRYSRHDCRHVGPYPLLKRNPHGNSTPHNHPPVPFARCRGSRRVEHLNRQSRCGTHTWKARPFEPNVEQPGPGFVAGKPQRYFFYPNPTRSTCNPAGKHAVNLYPVNVSRHRDFDGIHASGTHATQRVAYLAPTFHRFVHKPLKNKHE